MKGGHAVMLLLRCADGNTYTFKSINKPEIQVLEIAPSRCWLVEAVLAAPVIKHAHRVPVEPSLQRPLEFSAGRAHYLGDYFGKEETSRQSAFVITHFDTAWVLSPVDDRYESTTAEMKRVFPSLASLPTVDTRLIPMPARKTDNGVGAAPGEPPMTPARVALVAPFIKRSYASPAECEAACPTGQCRPYRGESGPAIACVTRCNTDKDCPEGLACNCPAGAGDAGASCHPIATTPQDPMSRICLSVEAAGQRR